jgi:hypothetical protein
MSNNHRRLWSGPGTDNFGLIVTDPGVFQIGFDDIGGTMNFIDAFTPADFINPDLGLSEIGGGAAAALLGLVSGRR